MCLYFLFLGLCGWLALLVLLVSVLIVCFDRSVGVGCLVVVVGLLFVAV